MRVDRKAKRSDNSSARGKLIYSIGKKDGWECERLLVMVGVGSG